MIPEEYMLLKQHDYSYFAGKMGEIFWDWHNKKIKGNEAAQNIKRWYEKGLEKLVKCEHVDIQQRELKRQFDSLYSYICDWDLIDDDEKTKKRNSDDK
jgi:glutathionyl-hydroquinone reductase